jgi:hypothetical protein
VRLLAAVGLALLGAGVVLGLIPALSDGAGGCGSPFAPAAGISRPDPCGDRLAGQRTAALGLALVGGSLGLAGLVLHLTDPARPPAEQRPY